MKAKFYVATLSAAIDRASRIAPNKGIAFDKAAGIVIEVDPDKKSASLRATNLEVFYREEIKDVVDYGEEKVTWRLPAHLLDGIINRLPPEKEVTFSQRDGKTIRLYCGKRQAKLNMMPDDIYPTWQRVDADALLPAPGFAHRVAQVAWATDPDVAPFVGVNIDGEHLNATDRYRLARVPCKVPLDDPVTAPMSLLATVIKNVPGEVSLAATEDNLLMKVGDEIEIVASLIAGKYPDLGSVLPDDFSLDVKVNREQLRDAIQAMLVLVKNERYPLMEFEFDEGEVGMFMSVPETGDMADSIEGAFSSTKKITPYSVKYTPDYLVAALDAATSEHVIWSVGSEKGNMTRIADTQGDYVAYLAPRSAAPPPKKEDEDDG